MRPAKSCGITKFYVAYHDVRALRDAAAPPDAVRLHLDTLDIPAAVRNNSLAESRALLWMALNPSALPHHGYVGLFQASYNTKFDALPPLDELPAWLEPRLDPTLVYAAATATRFMDHAAGWHPGMDSALARVFARVGQRIENLRPGPVCNSIVAHHTVWRSFLPAWLKLFVAGFDEINACNFDQSHCKDGLAPAYLCERFTTAWFASQTDINVRNIETPDGNTYMAAPESAATVVNHARTPLSRCTVGGILSYVEKV